MYYALHIALALATISAVRANILLSAARIPVYSKDVIRSIHKIKGLLQAARQILELPTHILRSALPLQQEESPECNRDCYKPHH